MTRIEAFAAAHGYDAPPVRLAQDASFNTYWRLGGGPRPALVLECAADHAATFAAIGRRLRAAGLRVPEVMAAADGLVLLEDFGDALLGAQADAGAFPRAAFIDAVDALAVLGRVPAEGLPCWGAAQMKAATAATFLEWWWPARFGAPPDIAVRADFGQAMDALLAPLEAGPYGLVHRDYFAGNLFALPKGNGDGDGGGGGGGDGDGAEMPDGARRIGIIDFADAARGSPAYDLVSLVQDARRDIPEDFAAAARARLLALRPELDPAEFARAFAICAAQRHLRVACLWVRLARRDGKPHYLRHGRRCWALLERALDHPAAAPLAAFMDIHVPAALRGNPQEAS